MSQLGGDGELRCKVTAERGAALREPLFDYAVGQGLKLLELNHESTSLEDIFLKLTHGTVEVEDAAAAGGDQDE